MHLFTDIDVEPLCPSVELELVYAGTRILAHTRICRYCNSKQCGRIVDTVDGLVVLYDNVRNVFGSGESEYHSLVDENGFIEVPEPGLVW